MNGIDPAIVSRADELASLSSRGENLVMACARLSKKEEGILEEAVRQLSFTHNMASHARLGICRS
jgi:hypothetical protein